MAGAGKYRASFTLAEPNMYWPWTHGWGHPHGVVPLLSPLLNFDPMWKAMKPYACKICYNLDHSTLECPLTRLKLGGVAVCSFQSRDKVLNRKPGERLTIVDKTLEPSNPEWEAATRPLPDGAGGGAVLPPPPPGAGAAPRRAPGAGTPHPRPPPAGVEGAQPSSGTQPTPTRNAEAGNGSQPTPRDRMGMMDVRDPALPVVMASIKGYLETVMELLPAPHTLVPLDEIVAKTMGNLPAAFHLTLHHYGTSFPIWTTDSLLDGYKDWLMASLEES